MPEANHRTNPETVLSPGKLPAGLLASLLAKYAVTDDASVIVPPGPGYDAAVIRSTDDIIVKSDPITFSTVSPATYLVAVNANDIACLGGVPRWITVTALFPVGTRAKAVEKLFEELSLACAADNIALIGGHSEVTPGIDRVLLSATLLGMPGSRGMLRPGGAQADDDIYLTRAAGIEGTSILATELPANALGEIPDAAIDAARDLIHDPGISIVRDARLAQANGEVHAMHDPTEGGVATAIHEIADAAGLGFEVNLDHIPVSSVTRALCATLHISPYGLLSSGALLFTAAATAREALETSFSNEGIELARIGRLVQDRDVRISATMGSQSPLPRYDSDEMTRVFARFSQEQREPDDAG